jgi:fibro-slime domain-containing protein
MARFWRFLIVILVIQNCFAEITVHILNPWRNDTCAGHRDSLLLQGDPVSGLNWSPGKALPYEGGGWFFYVFPKAQYFVSRLATFCGPETWRGWAEYNLNFLLDTFLLRFPASTKEIWIMIPDINLPAEVFDCPPGGKLIFLFNPWPDNSPRMSIGQWPIKQMHPRPGYCGWYSGIYVGPIENLSNVCFTDYFHTQQYSANGLTSGPGIDLQQFLSTTDTVYILPEPYPNGPPGLTEKFPGKTGECGSRNFSALFRDWKYDDTTSPNPSFHYMVLPDDGGHENMVQNILVAPDYKPRVTTDPNMDTSYLGHIETWYVTDTFLPGSSRATNDTSYNLVFRKGDYCGWEYDSDWMNHDGFYPLDSFINPNNLRPDPPRDTLNHNYHFTMEMHIQFLYRKGFNHRVSVQGGDDIWVFINRHLAIDLGGINIMASGSINLDSAQTDLELIDGATYMIDIFYAERCPIGADFKMQTSLDISNPCPVPEMRIQRHTSFKYYPTTGRIIPMRSVSGNYYSITGKKLHGSNIPPQLLIKAKYK